MAKVDIIDIMRSKKMDPFEFQFEKLWIPPMYYYLSPDDVEALRKIATSIKLAAKIDLKYKMIDDIMVARGFRRFSAGTNRVVYKCLEDTRFLVKIAVDKVGMQDNPLEYKNQFLLQPFVTKMFYISPCGTVGFCERVLPIKNKQEFKQIASDVFDILINKILGVYVVEDVGTKYFMNWGIRVGFGPVLLDYPYVYKLDGNKLFCTAVDPYTNQICNGEIDYDEGFNSLICRKCGKRYLATDLRDDTNSNKIVIKKGGIQMKVIIKRGDKVIYEPIPTDEVMVNTNRVEKKKSTSTNMKVCINRPGKETIIVGKDGIAEAEPEIIENDNVNIDIKEEESDIVMMDDDDDDISSEEESDSNGDIENNNDSSNDESGAMTNSNNIEEKPMFSNVVHHDTVKPSYHHNTEIDSKPMFSDHFVKQNKNRNKRNNHNKKIYG